MFDLFVCKKEIMMTDDLLKKGNWQTFDLLMTSQGFDNLKYELESINQRAPQIYVHVCAEGTLKNEVLRIGKAKYGVIDRWIKQGWGHGNTFLWSIGKSKHYASHADKYPNYLAFFACLKGLETKLHVLSCESIESMNQIEKDMIKYFHPIWESYKKSIKQYFKQNPEIKQPISKYGGAERAIISQRNGVSSLSQFIPDVSNFNGSTARKWKDLIDNDEGISEDSQESDRDDDIVTTEEYFMEELIQKLRKFVAERDWDQFHSPKNLAMALSVEVSELAEHFQWLTEEESYNLSVDKIDKIKEEIGDVMIYLTRLSDKLGIDPLMAAKEKNSINENKYPVDKAKGSMRKYTEL